MRWPESYFEGEFNLVEPGSQNQGGEDLSKPQVPRSSVRIRHVLKISFGSNRMTIFLVVFLLLFVLVWIKNQVLPISVCCPVSFSNGPLLLVSQAQPPPHPLQNDSVSLLPGTHAAQQQPIPVPLAHQRGFTLKEQIPSFWARVGVKA